jgi:hypothetical protein
MKKGILCLVLGIVVAGGCVPTVHELYTNNVTVFDSNLIGTWGEPNSEKFTIQRIDANSYSILYTGTDSKSVKLGGHLVSLGKTKFMDMELVDYQTTDNDLAKCFLMPVHYIVKIERTGSKLVYSVMDSDGFSAILKKDPDAVKHEKLRDSWLVTASTEELQKFVAAHADDKALFPQNTDMSKLAENKK